MPDLERRGQQAVALPMAELLAEARLPSPWDGLSGQADFDHILARTIDELEIMDRVRACQRIDEATDQERRLLIAIACYGWTTSASYEALSRDTGIRVDLISRHGNRLKKKQILRITIVHLSNGRRLRLFTLSGRFLMMAYRRWRGEEPALDDLPSAPIYALDDLVTNSTFATPSTLVSSYIDPSGLVEQQLTDVPGGRKSPALDDLPSAPPGWWERFAAQVGRISRPTPRIPKWPELAGLLDVDADPRGDLLREACARFLDSYSQPKHQAVRSLRAVVRSIYRAVIRDLEGRSFSATASWASDVWFAPEPEEQPELLPAQDWGPFPWEAVDDPEAAGIWADVLDDLRQRLPRPTFETWLRPTRGAALDGDAFTATAPTPFAVEWLERRMFHALQRTLEQVAGRPLKLSFRVSGEGVKSASERVDTDRGEEEQR